MAMYTFHFCNLRGVSSAFDAIEIRDDVSAFRKAGDLLGEHPSCDHIDVREGERPVVARHREQPIIRPINEPSADADRLSVQPLAARPFRRR